MFWVGHSGTRDLLLSRQRGAEKSNADSEIHSLCSSCQADGTHSTCIGTCRRYGDCGHQCSSSCHAGPCPPCGVLCEYACKHKVVKAKCGAILQPCMKKCRWVAECTTFCCLPCTSVPISKPCNQLLGCGHLCAGLSHETCTTTCTQCLTGRFPEKLQIVLPCNHTLDVQVADQIGKFDLFFRISNLGVIKATSFEKLPRQAMCLPCPTCQAPIEGLPRYSLINKAIRLPQTLDDLYYHFGRDLNQLMYRIYMAKTEYKNTRGAFRSQLGSGPLAGKANEYLVKARANMIHDLQVDIAKLRGNIYNSTGIS